MNYTTTETSRNATTVRHRREARIALARIIFWFAAAFAAVSFVGYVYIWIADGQRPTVWMFRGER